MIREARDYRLAECAAGASAIQTEIRVTAPGKGDNDAYITRLPSQCS
jgi:hypothetical protein